MKKMLPQFKKDFLEKINSDGDIVSFADFGTTFEIYKVNWRKSCSLH